MARLDSTQLITFGGIDTKSSPLAEPITRWLRCNNWVPREAGNLELRWGYDTLSASSTTTAFHSLIPFHLWNGFSYILLGQGATLTFYDFANTTVSPVSGTALTSSGRINSYTSQNRLYLGNGTDQRIYNGQFQSMIANGLRAPVATDFINFTISEGTRELSTSEASTITLTVAAGGSFSTTTTGYLVYVALFDTAWNDLGPATMNVGSGRVSVTGTGKKITVGNMLTPATSTQVKLIARTGDGDNIAYFCTNTSTAITVASVVGNTITINATAHGLSTGDVVIQKFTQNAFNDPSPSGILDGVFVVTVLSANQYTIQVETQDASTTGNSSGTVKRIVKAANATASVDVTDTARDTSFQVNSNRGLAPTSVGGSQPGYQFYVSFIYVASVLELDPYSGVSPIYGLHVGNRYAIGTRYAPTERANVRFSGIPAALDDAHWRLLIGRTGDGAEVPYELNDNSGNQVVLPQTGLSTRVIWQPQIDGNAELPTRNGVIPSQCTMFARVGDRIYAADPSSPTIRRSGSELDARSGIFVGDPAQSWADDDIETFPTARPVTGIGEVDYELFVGTRYDCAILSDLSGLLAWRGPWEGIGNAGARSMTKTPYGFFWVTGDKQLATFINGIPQVVSEEYEVGTLSEIGDSYLGEVALTYYKSAKKHKDEIRIECRDTNGNPFTIIHDFRLRDSQSPFGQGYKSIYAGQLGTAFIPVAARDGNYVMKNFAGGANGTLYELYKGASDVGNEYLADAVGLMNLGVDRVEIPWIDWHGDSKVSVSVGTNLKSNLATTDAQRFETLQSGAVQTGEDDFLYRAELSRPQPFSHLFVRFQLTSHSADGNLDLNDPPHVPLENYGRIWDVIPSTGEQRGR